MKETKQTKAKTGEELSIKRVIHSNNVCTIIWNDDTKTQSRCSEGDVYSKEAGFLIALLKKFMTTADVMALLEEYVWSQPKQEEVMKQQSKYTDCRRVTTNELRTILGDEIFLEVFGF